MLILASASPRRHELLQAAGIAHKIAPVQIDERMLAGEQPANYVQRLAREKALSVAAGSTDTVLGADTVVWVGGEILGKPSSEADARRMLRLLSGGSHSVFTGIALRRGRDVVSDLAETVVCFDPLTEAEIAEYIASGEPMDKAGAYAIQGLASRWVRRIEGCYHNVVGLPVSLVYRHLRSL
jgi:septum formation protein